MRFAPGGDAEEVSKRVAHNIGYFGGNGLMGGSSKEASAWVPTSEARSDQRLNHSDGPTFSSDGWASAALKSAQNAKIHVKRTNSLQIILYN
jgi:hypothetical protein